MNYFKVYFQKGYSLTTGFNGALSDAKAYYLNRYFNMGGYPKEVLVKGIDVKEAEK